MGAKNPKRKGNAGERELMRLLHTYGLVDAARTEGSGRYGDGDISGVKGIHIEAKRTERFSPYENYEQAQRDRGIGNQVPIVFHRKNNGQWMVFMSANDFLTRFYLPAMGMPAPEKFQPELGE